MKLFIYLFLFLFLTGENALAQGERPYSIFDNYDSYEYYRIDTIIHNDKIFELPNYYSDTSFLIYSVSKLWNEDICGHKGYRVNLIQFLKKKIRENGLLLYKKDIIYHLGEPESISEYRNDGFLENENSTKVYVPELDVDLIILEYSIVKSKDCKSTKEFVEFSVDIKSNKVCSVDFFSDSFETEKDVGK